jgi:hypothetical protein
MSELFVKMTGYHVLFIDGKREVAYNLETEGV